MKFFITILLVIKPFNYYILYLVKVIRKPTEELNCHPWLYNYYYVVFIVAVVMEMVGLLLELWVIRFPQECKLFSVCIMQ